MRRVSLRLLAAAVAACAAVSLGIHATGCGGSSIEQAALEQYLGDLRPALEGERAAVEETAAAFADANDPAVVSAALHRAARRLASAADITAQARYPDSLEEANDGLVVYYRQGEEAADTMAGLMARVAGARTEDEMEELDREWNEAIAAAAADNVDTTALVAAWQESLAAEAQRVGFEIPGWYRNLRKAIDTTRQKVGRSPTRRSRSRGVPATG